MLGVHSISLTMASFSCVSVLCVIAMPLTVVSWRRDRQEDNVPSSRDILTRRKLGVPMAAYLSRVPHVMMEVFSALGSIGTLCSLAAPRVLPEGGDNRDVLRDCF
jgi:hypothetical protein